MWSFTYTFRYLFVALQSKYARMEWVRDRASPISSFLAPLMNQIVHLGTQDLGGPLGPLGPFRLSVNDHHETPAPR